MKPRQFWIATKFIRLRAGAAGPPWPGVTSHQYSLCRLSLSSRRGLLDPRRRPPPSRARTCRWRVLLLRIVFPIVLRGLLHNLCTPAQQAHHAFQARTASTADRGHPSLPRHLQLQGPQGTLDSRRVFRSLLEPAFGKRSPTVLACLVGMATLTPSLSCSLSTSFRSSSPFRPLCKEVRSPHFPPHTQPGSCVHHLTGLVLHIALCLTPSRRKGSYHVNEKSLHRDCVQFVCHAQHQQSPAKIWYR